jgi:alpha-beta hydrolase superfamily lysophospholipase
LLVAGCAAVGGPLPADSVIQVAALPMSPTETLRAADGSPVPLAVWRPAEPTAVILAFHGYGDHGRSTFSDAAEAWAEHGIATLAVDQRGFGRSASRGRWPGAEALIADAVALSAQVRARYPCVPLVVVGHSMGGGIVLGAAAQNLLADGIVLAAPAIWGGEHLNPVHRMAAWAAAMVAPEHRFTGRGIVNIVASDNIEALRQMRDDPLYIGRPSARELLGLVRVTDQAEAAAGRVDLPALLLLGAKDQIVPNDRVGAVFASLRGPKRTIAYPEGWHLLFRDLQAPNVWRDVADWVLARPAPACGARGPAVLRAALPAERAAVAEAG